MTQLAQVTVDDVLDLETSGRSHVEVAETLVRWSAEARREDDWEYSPASLLVAAAEHLDMGGVEGADELFDRAEESAGHDQIDLFEPRVAHALQRGDLDTARKLEEQARRCPVKRYESYEMMADTLDEYGEHQSALRWANIGLRRMENLPDADAHYDHLLLVRYRMRRRQQATIDGYDEEAELVLADLDEIDD